MVCSNCGSENERSHRFCSECGHPLHQVCPNCGAANDPAARFCDQCGSDLDRAAEPDSAATAGLHRDPHERRFLAVLFADLVDFTQFAEGRDPEVVRAALTTYFERSREVIDRFGGTVEKFIGDAVMAVWGATVAHEDDAERAVRAGLELVDMVSQIGDELDGGDLALRVGVLTGEASVSPSTPEQGFVVGDLVNTAARLQSIAAPGSVVVGDACYRMLGHAFHFEAQGKHAVKGKAAPIEVWRAVRVKRDRTHRDHGARWESPFVGRKGELRLLKDALHATGRSGRSRLVSVVGEAGIGKSRLAWELRKYIEGLAAGIYWHVGRSPAYDEGLTLWALGEMVRQRAGIAETDDLLRSRTRLRTAVAQYVPTHSEQEWIEPKLAALLGLDPAPTGEQSEFFAAVRRFFQCISERGTTMLVFEDFHWADSGLIEFVSELVELSPRHPILAVTLARPDLSERAPGWGAGRRNFASAHLGPLSQDEMAELVAGMVIGIDAELIDAVVERASGIPLYAVELVRMYMAEGVVVMDDDACCKPIGDLTEIRIPDTVRAVVEARLDRLSSESRSFLEDAAVLGAAFTRAGLAAISGLDPARLNSMLEPLVRRELLEYESDPRSPERGQYRFVQSMIRDVAYGRLTREERRVRHLRAADFFAELGEPELAGAVASHLMAAHRVTIDPADAEQLATRAAAALSQTADRATHMHSHAQGLGTLEQAIAICTDPTEMADLWQRAARSASALARHETAIDYAYRSLAWHREHSESPAIAGAAAVVGEVLCSAFRPGEAIEVLEPILGKEPVLDEPAAVAAGAMLARAYLMSLRNADAATMADTVIGPAERFVLLATIVDTMITRGTALGNLGRMHEAIALLQAASRYALDHDLRLAQMRAAFNLGHLLSFDDHAGAAQACRSGLEQAERLGDVRFIESFSWAVSAYLDHDGRFEEAKALRDEVRDRIELPAVSSRWWEMTDLIRRVECGDAAAIAPAYEAARGALDPSNPQSPASVALMVAKLDTLTGRFESAYAEVMAVDGLDWYPEHFSTAMTAAAMLGDVDKLEAVTAAVESSPARGRLWQSISSAAAGALMALRGHPEGAVAPFLAALSFDYFRLDRARLQALFATLVGREFPEGREASDAAFAFLTEVGAVAYLDLYAAGMPPGHAQRVAGQ